MSVLYAIGFKFQVWILNIFLIFFPAAQNWKKVLMLNVWFLQKINNEHSTFKLCHNKISWWDAEDTRIKTNFRKAFAPLFNKVVTSHHISLGTYFCSGSQKKKGRKKLEMDCIKNKHTFFVVVVMLLVPWGCKFYTIINRKPEYNIWSTS